MPAIPHVLRRGAIYYWRRRVPSEFMLGKSSTTLILSLRTSDPRRARFLSGQIAALTDIHFFPAIAEKQLAPRQVQIAFREIAQHHLDQLDAAEARERPKADDDWRDSRRTDKIMRWVYRLLAQGSDAMVDRSARETMVADGFGDSEMAEVAQILAFIQQHDGALKNGSQETVERSGIGGPRETQSSIAEIVKARIDNASSASSAGSAAPSNDAKPMAFAKAHASTRSTKRAPNVSGLDVQSKTTGTAGAVGQLLIDRSSSAGDVARVAPRTRAVRPSEHPIMVFGERLIKRKERDGDWDAKTSRQARHIYQLFTKLLLEVSIVDLSDVRQSHFGQLDDLLSSVATSYGRSPKDSKRTTAQLRAIGAMGPAAKRGVAPETRNRHLTFLRQLLTFIKGQGVALDRDIDLTLLRSKVRARGRTKRATFNAEELDGIFRLPCFTGCAGWEDESALLPGPHVFHRALYFAILLLYYTGARREEICGLTIDDVQCPELNIDGEQRIVPCIYIARNAERRIKNVQSIRLIPILPEMIRLGFLDYVALIRALGYTLLFPDLKSPTSRSLLGDRLYKEFVRGLSVVIPEASARKKTLHSFRKTFGNSLKQAGVTAEIRGDILGHGGETVTEEIYCDPVAVAAMLEHMSRLPVITSHLEARPIQLMPWVLKKRKPPFSRGRRG